MLVFSSPAIGKRSEKDKVEYIYRQYYPLMRYAAGRALGGDGQDAEDAVHDAMIKVIKNIGIIDVADQTRLKNLLCVIVRNCAMDRLRKKGNRNEFLSEIPEDLSDTAPLPEQAVANEDTLDAILKTIGSLPEIYRGPCVLKYFHGYKEKEIAALLGIPEKTASTRIHRGKMVLRDALRKEGYHE